MVYGIENEVLIGALEVEIRAELLGVLFFLSSLLFSFFKFNSNNKVYLVHSSSTYILI